MLSVLLYGCTTPPTFPTVIYGVSVGWPLIEPKLAPPVAHSAACVGVGPGRDRLLRRRTERHVTRGERVAALVADDDDHLVLARVDERLRVDVALAGCRTQPDDDGLIVGRVVAGGVVVSRSVYVPSGTLLN